MRKLTKFITAGFVFYFLSNYDAWLKNNSLYDKVHYVRSETQW